MASAVVHQAGARVEIEHQGLTGYFLVVAWHQLVGGRMQEERYEHLTWTEATDVILVHLDEHRPGYQVGDGWTQPPLW